MNTRLMLLLLLFTSQGCGVPPTSASFSEKDVQVIVDKEGRTELLELFNTKKSMLFFFDERNHFWRLAEAFDRSGYTVSKKNAGGDNALLSYSKIKGRLRSGCADDVGLVVLGFAKEIKRMNMDRFSGMDGYGYTEMLHGMNCKTGKVYSVEIKVVVDWASVGVNRVADAGSYGIFRFIESLLAGKAG